MASTSGTTLCGSRACRSARAVVPCKFSAWPMNPLRGSCVSDRSRCGAVRTFYVADEPSPRIAYVGSLSRLRCARFAARGRTLFLHRACRSTLAVTPCDFPNSPRNPPRASCVSDRIVLAVATCGFSVSPTNPLRGSCVRSHSLRRRSSFAAGRKALCGDPAPEGTTVTREVHFCISGSQTFQHSFATQHI